MPPQAPGMYQNGFPVGYPVNNLFNPQSTPFSQNQQQLQQPAQIEDSAIWVIGSEAAKSYPQGKNTRTYLWDKENPYIYIKTTDSQGVPSMVMIKYEVIEPVKPEDKFVTREEFIKTLNDSLSSAINQIKEALNGSKSVQSIESSRKPNAE